MIPAEGVTSEQARALLSVLGALLAAYGFFYTGVKDSLAEAARIEWAGFRSKRDLRPSLKKVINARNVLVILAACATTVATLFLSVAAQVLSDIDPRRQYAPDKAALLLLEVFWVGLAGMMLRRAMLMASHVGKGKDKERDLNEV